MSTQPTGHSKRRGVVQVALGALGCSFGQNHTCELCYMINTESSSWLVSSSMCWGPRIRVCEFHRVIAADVQALWACVLSPQPPLVVVETIVDSFLCHLFLLTPKLLLPRGLLQPLGVGKVGLPLATGSCSHLIHACPGSVSSPSQDLEQAQPCAVSAVSAPRSLHPYSSFLGSQFHNS